MRKIQIVDDEPGLLDLLAEILATEGYEVVTSSDGIDALIQFSLEAPDLLITDLNMPRMDGSELCRRVRTQSSLPIIVMSATSFSAEDKAEAFRNGADAFLVKPFDLAELRTQIEALLARTKIINGY